MGGIESEGVLRKTAAVMLRCHRSMLCGSVVEAMKCVIMKFVAGSGRRDAASRDDAKVRGKHESPKIAV